MGNFELLKKAFIQENKTQLKSELANKGNVLADEQKLLRAERKSMTTLYETLLRSKWKIPQEEFFVNQ